MSLSEKQMRFTRKLADLISFAYSMGYGLTFGDAYRDPRLHGEIGEKKSYSHRNSAHKVRLAVDFNLFVNGEYKSGYCEEYKILHDYWQVLGGAPMIENDPNHFSFEHNGVR